MLDILERHRTDLTKNCAGSRRLNYSPVIPGELRFRSISAHWNDAKGKWSVEAGDYVLLVGTSSTSIDGGRRSMFPRVLNLSLNILTSKSLSSVLKSILHYSTLVNIEKDFTMQCNSFSVEAWTIAKKKKKTKITIYMNLPHIVHCDYLFTASPAPCSC